MEIIICDVLQLPVSDAVLSDVYLFFIFSDLFLRTESQGKV